MTTENNVAAQAGRNKSVHSRSGLPNYGCSASNSIKGWHERNSSGVCALCGDGPIAAQAGDEPMPWNRRYDLGASVEAAMLAEIRDWRAYAAQISPRATADVERDAARYKWLMRELGGSISMDLDLDCISEIDSHIDAAIATTKPGA